MSNKSSGYGATDNNSQSDKQEINQSSSTTSLCRRGYLCDPHRWPHQCIFLLLICYTYFATFYCTESPGGLEDVIIDVMEVDAKQYDLLRSVSAWPNVIICLVGGIVVDRLLGLRLGYLLAVIIPIVGQSIWAIGAFVDRFWVMLVGRFFIGIGSELTAVVSSALIVCSFDKSKLSFAISLLVTAARLGSAAGLACPQFIYKQLTVLADPLNCLCVTLLVGVGLLLLAIVACVFIIIMDIRAERILQREKHVISRVRCSDLKQLSITYWLTVIITGIYFSVVFSFVAIAQVFYVQKFGLSLEASGVANALIYSSMILATPLLGCLIDTVGYHGYWAMLGMMASLAAHLTLTFSYEQNFIPYVAGVVYSISYTIIVPSLWSLPGLLVEANHSATAYGIIHCAYDLGTAVLTIVTGLLVDDAGYFVIEIVFSLLLYFGIISTILFCIADSTADEPLIGAHGHCGGSPQSSSEKG